jgi:hypothetical protein
MTGRRHQRWLSNWLASNSDAANTPSALMRKPGSWVYSPLSSYLTCNTTFCINATVSYHVPHQSQVHTQSSRLSPRTPSLLVNPLHFLQQYTSPFTTLPSVLFYKEGLYIFTQHRSKNWCGSPFTGSPHHHLVRVEIVNTTILILIVSILL